MDLIWVPEHDRHRGANVIDDADLAASVLARAGSPRRAPRPIRASPRCRTPRCAIVLGGPSGAQHFTAADLVAHDRGGARDRRARALRVMATPSRRTPPELLAAVREGLGDAPGFVWDGRGENPYLAMLALADALLVTGDSANMVGEATATGAPVHVFEPSRRRIAASSAGAIDALERLGAVQAFRRADRAFAYAPIDSSGEIAAEIARRFGRGAWKARSRGEKSRPLSGARGSQDKFGDVRRAYIRHGIRNSGNLGIQNRHVFNHPAVIHANVHQMKAHAVFLGAGQHFHPLRAQSEFSGKRAHFSKPAAWLAPTRFRPPRHARTRLRFRRQTDRMPVTLFRNIAPSAKAAQYRNRIEVDELTARRSAPRPSAPWKRVGASLDVAKVPGEPARWRYPAVGLKRGIAYKSLSASAFADEWRRTMDMAGSTQPPSLPRRQSEYGRDSTRHPREGTIDRVRRAPSSDGRRARCDPAVARFPSRPPLPPSFAGFTRTPWRRRVRLGAIDACANKPFSTIRTDILAALISCAGLGAPGRK